MEKTELLQQAQSIEQTLHMQTAQHATFRAQLLELENASKELSSAKDSYRIIGNIMVKTEPLTLKTELDQKLESLQHRIQSIERQEERLRQELKKIQDKVLQGD